MISEGLSALNEVYTFIQANDVLKILIGVAVGGVVLSVFMGIFFRGR